MSKAEEMRAQNYHFMAEGMRRLEAALLGRLDGAGVVPPEWQAIAQAPQTGGKVKLTLWVEADVVTFFRSMGRGHTTRMADVLKTFMHARLARVVKGPEAVDYSRRPSAEEKSAAAKQFDAMRQAIREGKRDW